MLLIDSFRCPSNAARLFVHKINIESIEDYNLHFYDDA